MSHGSAGTFDINLPVAGTRGVECRSSTSAGPGVYTMVFTFANNLVSVDSAGSTNGGPATVTGDGIGPAQNQYFVNLNNVSNAQYLSITLINAKDTTGAIGNVTGTMGVLVGDVNASGNVDGNDVSTVQGQTRHTVVGGTSPNFREDVNASGVIDGNDVSLTQSHTRTSLPSHP